MATPTRRGTVRTLTLDADALLLLDQMAPSAKRLGSFLSELVRAEAIRRQARSDARKELIAELLHDESAVLVR